MIRLEVAVAAPLSETLTYSLPEDLLHSEIPIGKRVLIPLGRRKTTGYVLGSVEEKDVNYAIKKVIEVLDSEPLFHPNQIPFFRWIARYYHYPIGEVIKTALPGGLTSRSVKKIFLTSQESHILPPWSSLQEKEPQWYKELYLKGSLTAAQSRKVLNTSKFRKSIDVLRNKGILHIQESIQKSQIKDKKEICLKVLPHIQPKEIQAVSQEFSDFYQDIKVETDSSLKLSEAKTLYHLLRLSSQAGDIPIPKKELTRLYSGASKSLDSLHEKKYVNMYKERVYRNPFGEQLCYYPRPETLSQQQSEVLAKLTPAIESKKFAPFLLHGVTGSGKTEIYLQAAERTLELGRDVIILVPEIALASQLEAHFVSRFREQIVLLHSGLSLGEKFDQWSLAASGEAKIVIGARSAIFAPLLDPGLIVVDEEHDQGYKQDDSLRYHGRDLAVLRASQQSAVVLLGSATPSVTSYHHAVNGKYTLLELKNRIGGRSLPGVTIVDVSGKKRRKEKGALGKELREALLRNVVEKKQSILLLNRRGFSGTYLCQECGTSVECLHCHVSLTLHKKKEKLICHYCGYEQTSKIICNSCNSTQLVPVGLGTERIEEEVRELLPDARIARLDSDTAKNKKHFVAVLKSMHNQQTDVLIGTQMIAKGHHFPNVTLVGIVLADGGLSMPDFRAAERVFQLVSQVTGRAGRGDEHGNVIIQTLRPDHYSLTYAQKHQYVDFFHHEMSLRTTPAFPPYVRLVTLRINGEREHEVRLTAQNVAQSCRQCIAIQKINVDVLGPAPAPLDRLCDKFRWQLLLRGANVEELHGICNNFHKEKKHLVMGKTRVTIDIDPENMM